jgi:hypothetical protein
VLVSFQSFNLFILLKKYIANFQALSLSGQQLLANAMKNLAEHLLADRMPFLRDISLEGSQSRRTMQNTKAMSSSVAQTTLKRR